MAADFNGFGLSENLLRGVYTYGFEKPSAVQEILIPQIVAGRDTVVQSPSGTGKTGAFGIGVVQRCLLTGQCAVVVAPTRELARQIHSVVADLCKYEKKISATCCVGGSSTVADLEAIDRGGVAIVVATPGRLFDIVTKRPLFAASVNTVVFDEADDLLLQPNFQEQVRNILRLVPAEAAICVCSATMPPELEQICHKIQRTEDRFVHRIDSAENVVVRGIRQYTIPCPELVHKIQALETMFRAWSISSSMIFCNSRSRVDWLGDQMESRGFAVSRIHAGMTDKQRQDTMVMFRQGQTRVLITTSLLARGIDVQSVQLVVLYDMIHSPDTYIHAIGRCGRYGRKGVSVALLQSDEDADALVNLSNLYGVDTLNMPENFRVEEMTLPGPTFGNSSIAKKMETVKQT